MKKIVSFLQRLDDNNNREWFQVNKAEYQEQKARFDEFVEKLIAGIREFDPSIGELSPKDCTYRIYRDTRFSQDKTPYKTHFGAFICPRGKKSGFSGYYFQVGARDHGFPSGCMLATGDYCIEPQVLKILREDIINDDEGLFPQAIAAAKDFSLDMESALKRVPRGFDPEHPQADLLRLRNFCLLKDPGLDYMLAPNLLERTLKDFKTTQSFLHLLNRAIEYAHEED